MAIPTANLIAYDWSEIENSVYVQDFHHHSPSTTRSATCFGSTLAHVLERLGMPREHWAPILAQTDFAPADLRTRLVVSLPGSHLEGSADGDRYGHVALARTLRELNATPNEDEDVELECQGSSIGAYTREWLAEFYRSACGLAPAAIGLKAIFGGASSSRSRDPSPRIRIIYPTLDTVKSSVLGTNVCHFYPTFDQSDGQCFYRRAEVRSFAVWTCGIRWAFHGPCFTTA